jgi:hypothetical protein
MRSRSRSSRAKTTNSRSARQGQPGERGSKKGGALLALLETDGKPGSTRWPACRNSPPALGAGAAYRALGLWRGAPARRQASCTAWPSWGPWHAAPPARVRLGPCVDGLGKLDDQNWGLLEDH